MQTGVGIVIDADEQNAAIQLEDPPDRALGPVRRQRQAVDNDFGRPRASGCEGKGMIAAPSAWSCATTSETESSRVIRCVQSRCRVRQVWKSMTSPVAS